MGFGAQEGAPSRPRKAVSQGPKVCSGVEAFGFRVQGFGGFGFMVLGLGLGLWRFKV